MTKTSHPAPGPSERGDYEIGYGRPPVASRFKLGNCCNPRGRPKRKKAAGELIEDAMNAKVKLVVEGRPTTMTKQQVIIHNLVNSAARGDHKAINTLFSLKARYQDSSASTIDPADVGLNDLEIIGEFLSRSIPVKPATGLEGSPATDQEQPVESSLGENDAQPSEPCQQKEDKGSDES